MEGIGFVIEHPGAETFLRIKAWGFWTSDTLEQYEAELSRRTTNWSEEKIRLLVDLRDQQVQSQQTITRLKSIHDSLGRNRPRVAVISGGHMQSIQSRRMNERADVRVFMSEPDAIAWLVGTDPGHG